MRVMRVAAVLAVVAMAPAMAADRGGGAPTSSVSVTQAGGQTSVRIRNVTHALSGELVSPRARRERLLLRLDAATTEVMDEKGIEGEVRLRVAPLDAPDGAAIFEVKEKGRAITFEAEDLVSVDRDDCCAYDRAYYSLWTGERLFEATTAPAWVEIGKEYRTHRVGAFRAATDDVGEPRLKAPTAIGLITYAASDRIIRQVLVEADKPARAQELRSLWDEQVALAWVDTATGAPLPPDVSAGGEVKPALRLYFVQAKLDLRLPLDRDDLAVGQATGAGGLKLTALPAQPLAGTWRVTGAVVAPWFKGIPAMPMKDRHIVFGQAAMRSGTVMDCPDIRVENRVVPPEGLFQGGLGDTAASAAAKLGFATKSISSSLINCSAGLFDFHVKEPGTVLFALDNVIYTMERSLP